MIQILLTFLGGTISIAIFLWINASSLEDEIQDNINTIKLKNETIYDLNSSLNTQNKAIIDLKIDYKKKKEEFEKRPKEIYITKYITKEINVTRSDCNDTKNLLFELVRIGID